MATNFEIKAAKSYLVVKNSELVTVLLTTCGRKLFHLDRKLISRGRKLKPVDVNWYNVAENYYHVAAH